MSQCEVKWQNITFTFHRSYKYFYRLHKCQHFYDDLCTTMVFRLSTFNEASVRHGLVVSIPGLYSAGLGFRSNFRHRLLIFRFIVVLSVPQYLKSVSDRFLPYPFHSLFSYHPVVGVTDTVFK